MLVKTDRTDARGIAQLMRLGWFRPVHCKSLRSWRGFRTAWREGEVRPTAQPKPKQKRGRRRPDSLVAVTTELRAWFEADPSRTGRELLERLQAEHPERYPDRLAANTPASAEGLAGRDGPNPRVRHRGAARARADAVDGRCAGMFVGNIGVRQRAVSPGAFLHEAMRAPLIDALPHPRAHPRQSTPAQRQTGIANPEPQRHTSPRDRHPD